MQTSPDPAQAVLEARQGSGALVSPPHLLGVGEISPSKSPSSHLDGSQGDGEALSLIHDDPHDGERAGIMVGAHHPASCPRSWGKGQELASRCITVSINTLPVQPPPVHHPQSSFYNTNFTISSTGSQTSSSFQ